MPRSRHSRAVHNKTVRKEANKLLRKGFNVDADIPGFQQPKTLGGYRPDIIASKGRQRKIIEVETPDSKDSARDKDQQQAFRESANRSNDTIFRREITGK